MSTTEALRTKLDALQAQVYELQAKNRRLREADPERTGLLDLEEELTQTREENVRLAQQVSELSRNKEGEIRDATEEAEQRLRETIAKLEREAAERDEQLEESRAAVAELTKRVAEAELKSSRAEEQLYHAQEMAELERFRAISDETRKWESREARLVRRLEELERAGGGTERAARRTASEDGGMATNQADRYVAVRGTDGSAGKPKRGDGAGTPGSQEGADSSLSAPLPNPLSSQSGAQSPRGAISGLNVNASSFTPDALHGSPAIVSHPPMQGTASGAAVIPVPGVNPLDCWSSALFAQQLPTLPNFTGDSIDSDGESFSEWVERLELVAEVGRWDDQAKLVNLATRLRGTASRFYRSCTPQQRSSYTDLVAALQKRFTPVRLQSVQSSTFHERRQRPSPPESVDAYAQELRKLFFRAYPGALQEEGGMGESVLAYQFVAGLVDPLKARLVGVTGTFDELLSKARFEEARVKETSKATSRQTTHPGSQAPSPDPRTSLKTKTTPTIGRRCYTCNGMGHIARDCPLKGRGAPAESRGRSAPKGNGRGSLTANTFNHSGSDTHVSMLQAGVNAGPAVLEPVQQETGTSPVTTDEAITEAISQVMGTMYGVSATNDVVTLGPTPIADVLLDNTPVKALLDTGSPSSIVSLEFFLQAAARKRGPGQTPAEWGESIRARLQPTTVALRSYGGDELEIISQVQCRVTCGNREVEVVLQVQKAAPVDLLLGTDVLPHLGFQLVQAEQRCTKDLLLSSQPQMIEQETSTQKPKLSDIVLPAASTPGKEGPTAIVRLIQAIKVPAQHSRLVEADIQDADTVGATLLFQPDPNFLKTKEVSIPETVIKPGKVAVLLVSNFGCAPVQLNGGEVIGRLEPTTIMKTSFLEEELVVGTVDRNTTRSRVGEVAAVQTATRDRQDQLLSVLGLNAREHLEEGHREQLSALVLEFSDCFALNSSELGRTSVVTHKVNTGDHAPIKQPPRRVPFSLRSKVRELTGEMLEQGVIQPSSSPWASPIVLVAKKDGSTRFCVDYRQVNAITKPDVFPLPRIDDSLDLLVGTQFFSTLDLASGYWQVGMDADSQEKTAFTTLEGLFEFTVMPFGLCNAPATFQRLMESVLAGLAREKCVVYLDDVLVMGKTFDEHIANLKEVFSRLRKAGLKLKPSKCQLLHQEVEFLGFVVSADGVAADPRKVTAVADFPRPHDLKSLRTFLGLTSYYRRFVPCYSSMAQPLYTLTRKDQLFVWTDECEKAFKCLKTALTQAPVLAYPHFDREFLLETDASGKGLGAVLSQHQDDQSVRPVAFASRTLQPHEKQYSISELEALGVVWAIKHFRHYLYGYPCTVYTDHEALKSLLNTPHPSGKLARWGMAIQELNLKIEYRPGRRNAKADALSRYPVSLLPHDCEGTQVDKLVAALQTSLPSRRGEDHPLEEVGPEHDVCRERQCSDPNLKDIIQYLEDGELPSDDRRARELILGKSQFTLRDGILYKVESDKTLRIIPPVSDRKALFTEVHEGPFGAHLREAKVHSVLSRHHWWPRMRADLTSWCRACQKCAMRSVGRPVRPQLTPIPVGGPFDRIGVDVLQLPKTRSGNRYCVVFMDYLTKWPEVFATADQTAPTIARLLVEGIVSRHGVPGQLLSDRGPSFLSRLVLEICEVLGVKKINTSAYHPQTDGLVERFNRTLTDMLAKTVSPEVEWDVQLPYVLFAYRAATQASTGESPFFLLYGRDPRLPTDGVLSPVPHREFVELDTYKTQMMKQMSTAWSHAQKMVRKAQNRQKKQHDKTSRNADFQVGDRVFVYMPGLKSGPAHKLACPYKGPYRIIGVYPNGAEVVLIERPNTTPLRVALNRVRRDPVAESPERKEEKLPSNITPVAKLQEPGPGPLQASTPPQVQDCAIGPPEDRNDSQEVNPLVDASEVQGPLDREEPPEKSGVGPLCNPVDSAWTKRLRPRKRTAAQGHAG